MTNELVFGVYGFAAVGALAVYFALPRANKPTLKVAAWLFAAVAAGALGMLLSSIGGKSPIGFVSMAIIALACAFLVITHPRPVYSALYFILVVLTTAVLMFMAGAEFLGAALVIVYAGAILVTYVFVIMLAQQSSPKTGGQFGQPGEYDRAAREPLIAVMSGFILMGTIAGVIAGQDWSGMAKVRDAVPAVGNTEAIGQVLMSPQFAVSVEIAGVLLMVAMIGAIAIARKRLPMSVSSSIDILPPGEIGKHVKPF